MRISPAVFVTNIDDYSQAKRFLAQFQDQVAGILNANVSFTDNMAARLLTFTFTGSGLTVGVAHGLGVIPTGYFLAGSNAAMNIYDGNKANTTTTLYLQASAAGTARVMVFA